MAAIRNLGDAAVDVGGAVVGVSRDKRQRARCKVPR